MKKLLLFLSILFASSVVLAQENCANGVDDDADGFAEPPPATPGAVPWIGLIAMVMVDRQYGPAGK